MSEHLPECQWNDETRVNRRCICPALRDCEARVLAALIPPVAPATPVESDPGDPLSPDGSLPTAAGALPVSGATSGGLAEVVGVASVGSHTHKTHAEGDPQHSCADFLAGLSAARDAVAALPKPSPNSLLWQTPGEMPCKCGCQSAFTYEYHQAVRDALAAIDALRGGSDE